MREVSLKRERTLASFTRHPIQQPLEPLDADPNLLRDAVFEALSSLSGDERSAFRERLFLQLRNAGLRVRQCLFMLGVSATMSEDLTAPEIATLIRYVRLVEPKAMRAVAGMLRGLLCASPADDGMPGAGGLESKTCLRSQNASNSNG